MTNIELEFSNNRLKFVNKPDERDMYSIQLSDLKREMPDGKAYWIIQLQTKSWVSVELLYRVAKVIKKYFPVNDIDWVSTFCFIERSSYLDQLHSIKEKVSGKPSSETRDDFIRRFELGIQENTPEINNEIQLIAENNLKDYGILP